MISRIKMTNYKMQKKIWIKIILKLSSYKKRIKLKIEN